ncbi:hypothetical protein HanPI659440_Chr13g0521301 [Helianthus annuus]|nr:hypothetical protein HanPI659440_Chr13g0521301 [Helianthus annuus]
MSENVFSSVTQIPSIAEGVIQTQSQSVQSTARNEPTGRLKRDRSSTHVTLSVDETGREILTCNFCQNVIYVGGEMASCEKVTSNACFTIPEEEEEEEEEEAETAVRNVKALLVQGINDPSQFTIEFGMQMCFYTQIKRMQIEYLCILT